MPIVTAIKPQKNKKRINVYLDDKFGFGIDLDNLVILNIKIGNDYSTEQVEEIVKKSEFQKTLDKLLMFATLRPRSKKEILNWFKKKKVHESLHDELIEKLKKFELVDDKKFAKWWIDQRLQFKSKSKKDLIFELRSKGIKTEVIDDVLENTEIDEGKMARDLISKKIYKWQKFEKREKIQKITQYLVGKGFGFEIAKKLAQEN